MNNRLRELRLSKNLTLKQVGEGVGLAANTISRYEISNREPSLEVWKKLADFFGVTVSYLLGLSSRKQIKNRIRDVRIQKRMSQKELADKIQMTQQAISLYEQGIREPNSEIWQKLADCFDVSVPYLQGYPFAKCHWCGNEFALAAEFLSNYFHKGDAVQVQGRIQTRTYDDKNGNKVFVTEVVAYNINFPLTSKSGNNSSNSSTNKATAQNSAPAVEDPFVDTNSVEISDDDLPF